MKKNNSELANAIRFLSIDAVEKANSGHPGMPKGMADVVTILFKHFLKFDPKDPSWINRDRFILSAGHGSMLLYAILYLTGYKSINLKDIKNFRQLNSICAGHPEYVANSGIETTTGPLGQGIANGVGFALAEEILKQKFGSKKVNHKTYILAGDGCLMEGISHEAMSLAGHLKLKNLIMLFDNNSISIDGPTSLAVSDDYKKRFISYGWNFYEIDGHSEKQIYSVLKKVKFSKKPTIISCKTLIGFGSPNKSGTEKSHGSPLGKKEVELVRKKLDWNHKPFHIPPSILRRWRNIGKRNSKIKKIKSQIIIPEKSFAKKLNKMIKNEKKIYLKNLDKIATRKSSEIILSNLTKNFSNIIGGSADLAGSNNTKTKYHKIIKPGDFKGNYIHYGVREHAMCGIMNGLSLHSNLIPYGGTFLIFSDYCKPSIRLSALMKKRVIYVMTHDSIGLGEDGPTHQPIEQLAGLRAIPNLTVFRPADTIETIECWELSLKKKTGPSLIALTRQKVEPARKKNYFKNMCSYGAYEILRTNKKINLTILASGSEVETAVDVSHKLATKKIYSKVISFPSHELFDNQSKKYRDKILNETKIKISIEAATIDSWKKYVGSKGLSFGINNFGKSAPYKDIYKYFNLDSKNITKKIIKYIKKN